MSKNWYLLNVIAFVFSYIPNVTSQKLNPAEYIEYFRNLLPPPKSEVIGQKFLIEEPHKVEIAIHSGIISLDAARLNLDRSTIDISYNGLEKEIENTDYAYVVINHPLHQGITYYPAAKNKSTNKNLTGFVYYLDSAETTIMVNVYNYLKKAHKDAKITGGETRDKFIFKSDVYVLRGSTPTKISKKGDLKEAFPEKSAQIDALLKTMEFDSKNPHNIYKFVEALKV